MKLVFGLTGPIACGKSTASKILSEYGVQIVDADVIAREVVEPGTEGLRRVVETFGEKYLNEDGTLNRKMLGAHVFKHPTALKKLDRLMGPIIDAAIDERVAAIQDGFVCVDAALMVKTGSYRKYDPLVVVVSNPMVQMERLMARNGLTEEQAHDRICSQPSIEQHVKVADHVIWNDGHLEGLRRLVHSTFEDIKAGRRPQRDVRERLRSRSR